MEQMSFLFQKDIEETTGKLGRGGGSKILVQVPAIETCFMSIDEIARILSKCQSPYIGGEIEICLRPRGYIEGKRSEFSKSQEYQENKKKYGGNMKKYEEIMKDLY